MLRKREVLDLLTRDELLDLADRFEVDVADRRVKAQLVEALAASRRASLAEMLGTLSRDRLKDLCAAFGLDPGGERELRVGAALHPSSRADRPGRLRPGERVDVVESVGRG